MIFSGYLVLRKPEFNFDELGRGAFLPYAPKVGCLYYGGVDRMQWFDIDEDYYSKKLPPNLLELRNEIFSSGRAIGGIRLCSSLEEAEKLLAYSNKEIVRNELVKIYCGSFSSIKNELGQNKGNSIVGCDMYCDGYGSLIRAGIYTNPEIFNVYSSKLNKNGIFDFDENLMNEYVSSYRHAAQNNLVEEMVGSIHIILLMELAG
ncbi:hypothetical protein ACJJH9_18045 [Microbulbifer sp. DLAB2-AF]|uniref:hypothetical protein n=1 Tax=Microbulbifer sp. DLAB2-AF TaxID=3243395 RepID=UPI0040392B66